MWQMQEGVECWLEVSQTDSFKRVKRTVSIENIGSQVIIHGGCVGRWVAGAYGFKSRSDHGLRYSSLVVPNSARRLGLGLVS